MRTAIKHAPNYRPIAALTLGTAAIHAYLNVMLNQIDPAMTLNALGYLALLGAYLLLPERRRLVTLVFIAFTVVTIVGWLALGYKGFDTPLGIIGWVDKLIEAGLVAYLVTSLRRTL
jgi:membrane associated rhomboid family serine protease